MRLLGIDVHVSPSIGMAFYPQRWRTVDTLLAHADAAMYSAKERGRNNVQCYAEGMSTRDAGARASSRASCTRRCAAGSSSCTTSPRSTPRRGRINSAEALIRWRHPQRGLLLPAEFIPIAEECGLLDAIGEWVLLEACRQAKIWQQQRAARRCAWPSTLRPRSSASSTWSSRFAARSMTPELDPTAARDRADRDRGHERCRGVGADSGSHQPHGRVGLGR